VSRSRCAENAQKTIADGSIRICPVDVVESLLHVRCHSLLRQFVCGLTNRHQANPKLAQLKDDDGRLAIHWAASYNQPEVVSLLISQKGFDVDAEVAPVCVSSK
jgi:ankyrin repeat protein